jgi:hypothetical protein
VLRLNRGLRMRTAGFEEILVLSPNKVSWPDTYGLIAAEEPVGRVAERSRGEEVHKGSGERLRLDL